MIRAVGKPLEEIIDMVKDFDKILLAGCDGCVTVCEAGGLKETKVLGSALRLHFTQAGQNKVVDETTLTRQCDKEYVAQLRDKIDNYDAVVSLACGGSEAGKCEVNPEMPCGWQLIYDRLKTLGQLDRFEKPVDPKDWTSSRDGGIRKIIREDLRI